MTWADGTRWDRERGRALVELLVGGYPSGQHMRNLVESLGLSLAIMPAAPAELGIWWYDLARTLHDRGKLRQAAEALVEIRPRLSGRVEELLRDDPTVAGPGNPDDPYLVHLLPGRRPLIDRSELRTSLRDFLHGNLPVFVVRGDSRTGKSYSLQLILHVTTGAGHLAVVHIDFSQPIGGDGAADLVAKIRRRLGLPRMAGPDDPTTRIRSAGELVDDLVGDYRFTDGRRRILVIDGLNRSDLQADTHATVAALMSEVINHQLPDTQLVLTGFDGDVNPAYGDLIMSENVVSITAEQVRLYFRDLAIGRVLGQRELDDLVAEAAVGQGDIEDVAQRVRRSVLKLLQPAGDAP